jgi:hypothetical protein
MMCVARMFPLSMLISSILAAACSERIDDSPGLADRSRSVVAVSSALRVGLGMVRCSGDSRFVVVNDPSYNVGEHGSLDHLLAYDLNSLNHKWTLGSADSNAPFGTTWAITIENGKPLLVLLTWTGQDSLSGNLVYIDACAGRIERQVPCSVRGEEPGPAIVMTGDWDGDGAADCVVSDPAYSSGGLSHNGRIVRVSTKTGLVLLQVVGKQYRGWFGSDLATLSDIDGDGVDDIVVASNHALTILSGRTMEQVYVVEGGVGGCVLGRAVTTFDWDSDGAEDVCVGWRVPGKGLEVGNGEVWVVSIKKRAQLARWNYPCFFVASVGRNGTRKPAVIIGDGESLLEITSGEQSARCLVRMPRGAIAPFAPLIYDNPDGKRQYVIYESFDPGMARGKGELVRYSE